MLREADAARRQPRRERRARRGETRDEIVAHRRAVAEEFGAALGIDEAVAAVEREIALLDGQQLDREHLAPRRREAFDQRDARLVEQVAEDDDEVARPIRSHSGSDRPPPGNPPRAVSAAGRRAAGRAGAGRRRRGNPHAVVGKHDPAEAVALAQRNFGEARGKSPWRRRGATSRARAASACAIEALASITIHSASGLSRSASRTKKRSDRA